MPFSVTVVLLNEFVIGRFSGAHGRTTLKVSDADVCNNEGTTGIEDILLNYVHVGKQGTEHPRQLPFLERFPRPMKEDDKLIG